MVKIVVTDCVTDAELEEAFSVLAAAERLAPVVLQPVHGRTPVGGPPSGAQLLRWQALGGRHLAQVRVIPQCHRLLGLR
jgi:7-carboxy-7-deazaguanine synthase